MRTRFVWVLPVWLLVACSGRGGTGVEAEDVFVEIEVEIRDEEARLDTAGTKYPKDDLLRVNHLQARGTHNSYHMFPPEGCGDLCIEYQYECAPLDVQLAEQGVRQFELDLHSPAGEGTAVYHTVIIDENTTCRGFTECMAVIKGWSDANPGHHPVFVMLEAKIHEIFPESFDLDYAALEQEISSVWPRERLLTPDDVRGDHPDLRTAVMADGWPTLGESRGRIVFYLHNHWQAYAEPDPALTGRLLFVNANPEHPSAAIMARDNPIGDEEEIRALVEQGFLIRTRTDSGLSPNPARLEAALRSGAHFLSTDFPVPAEPGGYFADIPGGAPSRCNPVTAPANCESSDIE